MKKHHNPKDPIKALKRAARDEFGLQPTRIASSLAKYARSREKRAWKEEVREALAY